MIRPVDTSAKDLWIGLFEVSPKPGTEFDHAGAYVQIVAPAASEVEYVSRARSALDEVGFDAVEWEDVFPLGPEWPPSDADPSLVEAAAEAQEQDDVAWGNWHVFPDEAESA
jgi:hypothetical protein